MVTAPTAALLFTASAGGPITFWGLAKVMLKGAIAVFATATWVLGATGGLAVLGVGAAIWDDGGNLRIETASGSEALTTGLPAQSRDGPQNTKSAAFSRQEPLIIDAAPGTGVDFHHIRDDVFFNIGGGVGAADYNGDGLLDIYVTNSADANVLYRNNGDGTFADLAVAAGVDDA